MLEVILIVTGVYLAYRLNQADRQAARRAQLAVFWDCAESEDREYGAGD